MIPSGGTRGDGAGMVEDDHHSRNSPAGRAEFRRDTSLLATEVIVKAKYKRKKKL